jgi:hypothetical protein
MVALLLPLPLFSTVTTMLHNHAPFSIASSPVHLHHGHGDLHLAVTLVRVCWGQEKTDRQTLLAIAGLRLLCCRLFLLWGRQRAAVRILVDV